MHAIFDTATNELVIIKKKFFSSTTNWVGIAIMLISILEYFRYLPWMQASQVGTFVLGLMVVVLRTYVTRQPVAGPIQSYAPYSWQQNREIVLQPTVQPTPGINPADQPRGIGFHW